MGKLKDVTEGTAASTGTENDSKVTFFTESDIDSKGRIINTYPTYFNRKQHEDLEEDIRRYNAMIAQSDGNPTLRGHVGVFREKLKECKSRLEAMDKVRPEFKRNADTINKMTVELGEKIGESMFTRSDMMKGLADAHEEARRMSEPVIKLTPEMAGIAKANGISFDRNRCISRNAATRLWQLGREALREPRNAEMLRRD